MTPLKDEVVTEENGDVTYKIEIGANRYDLLCLEGISRNLLIFQVRFPINVNRQLEKVKGDTSG